MDFQEVCELFGGKTFHEELCRYIHELLVKIDTFEKPSEHRDADGRAASFSFVTVCDSMPNWLISWNIIQHKNCGKFHSEGQSWLGLSILHTSTMTAQTLLLSKLTRQI